MVSRSNYGKIDRTSGMGGFLNPPTHPEHTISVRSSYGNTFFMSLSSAAEAEWLDPSTRGTARGILKAWKPLPIESPEVQDWIRQVLGYFRNCYRGDGSEPECWNASNLVTDRTDLRFDVDRHAGVHLIRKYYPEYVPLSVQFRESYWGKKPEVAA